MIELVHYVPGRLRVRARWLGDERRGTEAVAAVRGIAGVRVARLIRATGSLVILHDPEELSLAALRRELEARLGPVVTSNELPGAAERLAEGVAGTLLRSLLGVLVERSALALVRALV
jgi:hypothetical protein